MASHPNVNANQLEENWMQLLQDPDAPLLNRATQGSYPPGAAVGPFLLAYASQQGALPALPQATSYTAQGVKWNCAKEPPLPAAAGGWIANGCPAALAALGEHIGASGLANLFTSLGFYSTPALPLEMASPSLPVIERVDIAAIGQENLSVTPLQMALAAASLSGGGMRPAPLLAASILTPDKGWVAQHPAGSEATLLSGSGAATAMEALAVKDTAYWQVVALAHSSREELTWYLGGTLPGNPGAPLALALVLEERNPDLAVNIGQALLDTTQK
jgi:peptidoglycan glycosyltransferase